MPDDDSGTIDFDRDARPAHELNRPPVIGELEECILGCCLLDPALLAADDLPDPEDFQTADLRGIWTIMRRLGPHTDIATLWASIQNELQGVSKVRVADLMEVVPFTNHFRIYVDQIKALRRAGSTCGRKPVILVPGQHAVGGGHMAVGTDRFAFRCLGKIPPGILYRRGNDIGLIVGEPGKRRFDPLTSDATRRLIDEHVALFASKSESSTETPEPQDADSPVKATPGDVLRFLSCSRDLGGLVADAARAHPSVRDLVMLTPFPVYRPDWTLSPPGYERGIFYDEPPELRGMVPAVDMDLIDDLLFDFPFADESSRFNMIGLLLTPLIRHAVGNVPFHLIHSSMERTGKTKLVEMLGLVVVGDAPPAIQVSEREEETEKRITAAMRQGKPILFFDNLRDYLDSASLAALATAAVWEGRVLGKSELVSFPNRATVVLTGNNVRATGELVKRTVPILLQPTTDAPEDRTDFRHPDLPAFIAANRARLLGALIGLVDFWREAGRPVGRHRMGGFEAWAGCLGGVLDGSPWLGNAKEWRRAADSHGEDLALLVKAWSDSRGAARAQARDVAEIAKTAGLFPAIFAKDGPGAVVSFARRVLMPAKDRPVEGWFIRRLGSGSSSFWNLEPQKTPETPVDT